MSEVDRSALRLVFITPGDRDPARTAVLIDSVLRGGATTVLLREPQLAPATRRQLAEQALALTAQNGAQLVISRDVELALGVGAWGVHLGWDGPSMEAVRARAGSLIVGRSAHWPLHAEDEQADYVTLSPFGVTERSRPRPRLTPEQVDATLMRLNAPVVALGGIDLQSVPCLPAGLDGIAVIRALADATDPALAAEGLRGAVEHRWASGPMDSGPLDRGLLDRGFLDRGPDLAPS